MTLIRLKILRVYCNSW